MGACPPPLRGRSAVCRPKRLMYLWRAKDRLACRFRLDGRMQASRLHAPVKSEPVCGDHSAHRRDMRAFQRHAFARTPTLVDTVPFCCSQLGTASAAKSNWPHHLPTYLPPTTGKPSAPEQTFGSCSGPLRGAPRPCGAPRRRRGRRLAPGPRPAPPRPTTDRPAAPAQAYHRRRSKSDAGCGLIPCPVTRRALARPPHRARSARLLAAAAARPAPPRLPPPCLTREER